MKKFRAKEHIVGLNVFKRALNGGEFTEEELAVTLKKCGIPSNKVFLSELKKYPVIKKTTTNKYVFAWSTPIYYGVIDFIYERYDRRIKRYKAACK